MHRPVLLFVVVLANCAAYAAPPSKQILLWKTPSAAVSAIVHKVPATDGERFSTLQKYFAASECLGKDIEEQAINATSQKNLICTLEGSTGKTIVLAAHYEMEGDGISAVDDWSGAVMLPLISKALRATQRKHTFIFAELAGKEGARTFLSGLTQVQRESILAMVGFESLGVGAVEAWANPKDGLRLYGEEEMLASSLLDAAEVIHSGERPQMGQIWGKLKIDDTQEFHRLNVPAIMVHSIHWEDRGLLGSHRDSAEAINDTVYYNSYRLLSTFCAALDVGLDEKFATVQQGAKINLDLAAPLAPTLAPSH